MRLEEKWLRNEGDIRKNKIKEKSKLAGQKKLSIGKRFLFKILVKRKEENCSVIAESEQKIKEKNTNNKMKKKLIKI